MSRLARLIPTCLVIIAAVAILFVLMPPGSTKPLSVRPADFGVLREQAGSFTTGLKLQNKSDVPVNVKEMSIRCGCITVKAELPFAIAPGEEKVLPVSLDGERMYGGVVETPILLSLGGGGMVQTFARYEYRPKLDVNPREVVLLDSKTPATLTVTEDFDTPHDKAQVKATDDSLRVRPFTEGGSRPGRPSATYEIVVADAATVAPVSGQVEVLAADGTKVFVPVVVLDQTDTRLEPPLILMPLRTDASSMPVRRRVVLVHRPDVGELHAVTANLPVTVSFDPLAKDRTEVVVTLDPSALDTSPSTDLSEKSLVLTEGSASTPVATLKVLFR